MEHDRTAITHGDHEEPPAGVAGTGDRPMMKKLMHGAAALALTAGIFAATVQDAEAHRRGHGGGVAAGLAIGTILGLGIAGAYAARVWRRQNKARPRLRNWRKTPCGPAEDGRALRPVRYPC